MNNFKIKATVITPVSIGSGIQLSPYKDYFISNNKVHYVDENKLSQLVAKDPALMDTYVEGVANMDGNRSNFDLKGFVQNHLSMDPFDLVRNSIEFRRSEERRVGKECRSWRWRQHTRENAICRVRVGVI